MATRPGRPTVQEIPISSHFARDVHYVTGRRDPSLRADIGAGVWSSKPKTAAAIAQYAAIRAALGPARFYPGPNATNHLIHYLNNSGRRYTIDLEDMIQSVPTAKRAMVAEFRQAQRFLQQLPFGRHYFTSQRGESSYNYQAESADWFFAIGGYTYWGKGEARITPSKGGRHYAVDFTYCFYDRYNWDGGKEVTIAGQTVTDEFMGEFHRQGLAREFDCFGSIERRFEWDGDMAGPDEPTILKRPGR